MAGRKSTESATSKGKGRKSSGTGANNKDDKHNSGSNYTTRIESESLGTYWDIDSSSTGRHSRTSRRPLSVSTTTVTAEASRRKSKGGRSSTGTNQTTLTKFLVLYSMENRRLSI